MRLIFLCMFKMSILLIHASTVLIPNEQEEISALYNNISNIYNPSIEDFIFIQDYLLTGKRNYLNWLDYRYPDTGTDNIRYDLRARNLKIYDPQHKNYGLTTICYNTDIIDKEMAIVVYASLNSPTCYQNKINKLIKNLKSVGYKGHLLYRIGGWPDIAGGSLKLVFIPYAFKPCIIKEARDLGYKKVIWFDTSISPLKQFSSVFCKLDAEGYAIFSLNRYNLYSYSSPKLASYFNFTRQDEKNIMACAGGIMGFNFDHPTGRKLFDAYYKAAKDVDAFLTSRPDKSIICNFIPRRFVLYSRFFRIMCNR